MLCSFRRHIAVLTAAWFLCQAGAMTATPIAACELAMAGDAELPECCRNLKPGQTCPMHGHTAGQSEHACHMTSPCPTADAALLSLAVAFAPPTAGPIVASAVLATIVHAPRRLTLAAHPVQPEPPPPRLA